MASKLPVWGIDVGQCSLKALKLQQVGDEIHALAFDVVPHEKNLTDAEDANPIGEAIRTFAERNDLSNCQVVISVPGQQTLTRFTKMPPVEPKKIPDMVQYEASQQIPFDMDEVVWDYQVFTEADSPDVEVGIFAIRKELIRNYLLQFTTVGIEPIIVQTSPMASYNAIRHEVTNESGNAYIMLDMGAMATDLIVVEGERIWARPVPIGGNRFTEALVSAFKIPIPKAEKLKRNAAASKYARQIFQAMRPVFADLVSEIQRSIGFYTSTHREAQIDRIMGMGNAFRLPGLQKFLQQNLRLEVELVSKLRKLTVDPGDKGSEFKDNIMSLSVAYGLGLQGLGLAKVQSNLVPVEVVKSVLWRKKRMWFAASAACLALASGAIWAGNVAANGSVQNALGGADAAGLNPTPVGSVDQAMQIVGGSQGAKSPVEYLRDVVGASQKLQSELRQIESQKNADESLFELMSRLPENNVYIPRVLGIIHQAVRAAAGDAVMQVKDGAEYAKLAQRIPRNERRDIWIESIRMRFNDDDPAADFDSGMDSSPITTDGSGPGWAIIVEFVTTREKPAKWIDDTLMTQLRTLGRQPGRGIYIDMVKLAAVNKRTVKAPASVDFGAPPRGGNTGGRGGRSGRGGRVGERGGRGGGGLTLAGGGTGGGSEPVGGRGGGDSGGEGTPRGAAGISDWREKFKGTDPLTGEGIMDDHAFALHLIIRKQDTPAELIPEVYREATDTGTPADKDTGTDDRTSSIDAPPQRG